MVVLSDGLQTLPAMGNPNNIDLSAYKERDQVEVTLHVTARTHTDKTTNSQKVSLNADVVAIKKLK